MPSCAKSEDRVVPRCLGRRESRGSAAWKNAKETTMKTMNYTRMGRFSLSMGIAWVCWGLASEVIGATVLDLGVLNGTCGSHGTAGLGISESGRAAGHCLNDLA